LATFPLPLGIAAFLGRFDGFAAVSGMAVFLVRSFQCSTPTIGSKPIRLHFATTLVTLWCRYSLRLVRFELTEFQALLMTALETL
jgi:hypothetical protein